MLGRLLRALASLDRKPFLDEPELDVEVVVVDNDPAGSSRSTCDEVAQVLPFALRYVIEPRAGIPFARNSALSNASPDRDFFVMIDDDEVPEQSWLVELLRVQRSCRADMVAGPVLSELPADAPAWARRGRIFARVAHRTGDRIEAAGTGNILIAARVIDAFARAGEPWFDERLALTGGSDRHFFLRAYERGFAMVWANDAKASEEIPKSRVTLSWVMKRMYRQGINSAFCEIDLHRVPAPRAQMVLRGTAFIVGGLALLPLGAATGSHRLVHYARYIAYGAGMLQGVRGRLYDEYRSVHGG